MQPMRVYPEYALILTYDIKPGVYERYFRWIMNDFLPTLHKLKVYRQHVWHVIGGTEVYPERRLEFITEDLETLHHLMDSTEWTELESRLEYFTENYSYRVVKYTGRFKV